MMYVRGREDLGVELGPPARGTKVGLEILGPWASCSLELSFPIHTMGRHRGDVLLGLWKQEIAWRVRKKLSPNLVSKNTQWQEWETGLATLSSLSPETQFPPTVQLDLEGEGFRAAAGLQGGTASCLGTLLDGLRMGQI